MTEDEPPLTFTASIAPLQSAIKIASDGGARVSFDIPESEMPAIVRLVLYRGRSIKITVEEETQVVHAKPVKFRTWKEPKGLKS